MPLIIQANQVPLSSLQLLLCYRNCLHFLETLLTFVHVLEMGGVPPDFKYYAPVARGGHNPQSDDWEWETAMPSAVAVE